MNDDKKKELIPLLQAKLNPNFKILSIEDCNHKPHMFMIGPKHVAHAADNNGGMLGDATLKVIPCAQPGCKMLYAEHTHNTIVCVQLTKNLTNKAATVTLKKVANLLEENSIDGVTFVETKEKFRIADPIDKKDD